MRHTQKIRTISVFLSLLFFMFTFSFQVHASGAERPDLGEDVPVITDTLPNEPSEPGSDSGSGNGSGTVTPPPAPPAAYSHLDPKKLVPNALLAKTVSYFDKNKAKIKNEDYIVIIDFKQHSSKERMYVIDMSSGHVETYQTAHGSGSDANHDGYAEKFSNVSGSQASSVGFYLTAETYYGSHGLSLRLDGQSATNSNARSRAIVIHGAEYVTPGGKIGRSWGCPALDMRYYEEVINTIKGGVLIYAEGNS